jgi:hypothetical protein
MNNFHFIRSFPHAAAILAIGTVLTLLAPTIAGATLPDPPACIAALAAADTILAKPSGTLALQQVLDVEVAKLQDQSWLPGYCVALKANLDGKKKSQAEGARFTAQNVIDTAIRFEAFRVTVFRNAGVAPKLYFGFLDEQGRTAAYEKTLKETAIKVAQLLNAYGKDHGVKTTVSPKEIIVTHLAEGGALLLTDEFASVDSIHPVYGIGLDDFRIGFNQYPGLLLQVDQAFGTKLGDLATTAASSSNVGIAAYGMSGVSKVTQWVMGAPAQGQPQAKYRMTFVESILGTAVMYFYEKDLAEKKLLADHQPPLEIRPLDEQYAIASLVYNSGILFAPDRVKMVMNFDTGIYLQDTSEKTAARAKDPRPRLPVMLPQEADVLLKSGKALPKQMTSWNAVYHIMQRYGAWIALKTFSGDFDAAGNLAKAP